MADIPQSLDNDLDRSNLQVNQRCGNCKHLKRIANPAYEKLCKDLGMSEISRPCARFSADPTKIKFRREDNLRNAVRFLQELSADKLLVFASLCVEESKTRRKGFHFGMTVYLLAFGDDYVSNYRRMKVVSADRKYVNLVGSDGSTAMVFHKSVLTPKQWIKKKAWLENNERLTDPRYKKYTESPSRADMQLRQVRNNPDAQEFDSTNRHDFAATSGALRHRQNSLVSSKDRRAVERITPLDKLVSVRTR